MLLLLSLPPQSTIRCLLVRKERGERQGGEGRGEEGGRDEGGRECQFRLRFLQEQGPQLRATPPPRKGLEAARGSPARGPASESCHHPRAGMCEVSAQVVFWAAPRAEEGCQHPRSRRPSPSFITHGTGGCGRTQEEDRVSSLSHSTQTGHVCSALAPGAEAHHPNTKAGEVPLLEGLGCTPGSPDTKEGPSESPGRTLGQP